VRCSLARCLDPVRIGPFFPPTPSFTVNGRLFPLRALIGCIGRCLTSTDILRSMSPYLAFTACYAGHDSSFYVHRIHEISVSTARGDRRMAFPLRTRFHSTGIDSFSVEDRRLQGFFSFRLFLELSTGPLFFFTDSATVGAQLTVFSLLWCFCAVFPRDTNLLVVAIPPAQAVCL